MYKQYVSSNVLLGPFKWLCSEGYVVSLGIHRTEAPLQHTSEVMGNTLSENFSKELLQIGTSHPILAT